MGHDAPRAAVGSRPPRFASAALSTFGTQLTVAVLSFVSVLVMARVLGPAGRGEVALLTTVAMLSSALALLGVDEANVNFAGRDPSARRGLATNSLLLAATLGGLAAAVLAMLIELAPGMFGDTDPALRWLAVAVVPALILKIYLKFLIGADYGFGVTNLAWLLPPLTALVVNVGLAVAGHLTVTTAFGTWVAGHLLATALLVWYVARRGAGFGAPDKRLARSALGFGMRSHAGRVMMAGNYRVDQWFVGAMAGTRELGLYSIAVAWSEILFYLPTALVIVQRPYLVRAEKRDAGRRAAKVFRGAAAVTAVFTAGVVVLAPVLCGVVFGSDFAGATNDLRILAFGAFGILAMKLFGNALTAQRSPTRASAIAAVAFAATIALDLLLIPRHGGLGAAIASALAYTLGGAASVVVFRRFFGTRLRALVPTPRDVLALARELAVTLRLRVQRRSAGATSS